MTELSVILSWDVKQDIEIISDYIVGISGKHLAEQYVRQLLKDIASLSYLATTRPYSQWKIPRYFHPYAKVLLSSNKKWSIIFHIENDNAVVDRIIPTCMITH